MENELSGSVQEIVDTVVLVLTSYGLDVLGAVAILIIGWWLAGVMRRQVRRAADRTERIDETVGIFLSSMTRYVIIAVTVVAVLQQFGIETTSLIAVLGAAGLAIGLALQGTLSNVAAGVMLLIFRPFHVGDFVEAGGEAGSVKGINLFTTELSTPDNVQVIVPNASVWGSAVRNYSGNDTRRVDLAVGIGYDADIGLAMQVIRDVIDGDDRVHADPEPMIAVANLGDSSVDLVVRVWCQGGDYWPLRFDLLRAVKERLDAAGVTIPFPTRTVYTMSPGEGG